ncbi:spermatogenesis-associated protein 4 [Cololabis saira]|uniref:spermatogenesis-associated protein 4 n=1 Tax=Cololabis saira TaxID=129043 RepID=UPI002AD3184F|nr:spermatogenesis-associated protein 4 [Cololabis saira]
MNQRSRNTGLAREVFKWLHTFNLSLYPNNVRRDFSNGYLMAEICSHYYPRDFALHSYDKGVSVCAKLKNWNWIQQSLQKHRLHLSKDAVEGTIHSKPGAAELLLQEVYTLLTKSSISDVQHRASDFTDREYQAMLPSLARSTATTAIKNNLKMTEIIVNPDTRTNQRKVETILRRYQENRAAEKLLNPGCFQVKSDQRQPAAKYPKPHNPKDVVVDRPSGGGTASKLCCVSTGREAGSRCTLIKVHQPVKPSQVYS